MTCLVCVSLPSCGAAGARRVLSSGRAPSCQADRARSSLPQPQPKPNKLTTPTHAHGMSSSCRFIQITHYSLLVSSCTGGEAEQRMRCVRERVRAVHPQHWRRPHSAQQPTRRRTHTVGESAYEYNCCGCGCGVNGRPDTQVSISLWLQLQQSNGSRLIARSHCLDFTDRFTTCTLHARAVEHKAYACVQSASQHAAESREQSTNLHICICICFYWLASGLAIACVSCAACKLLDTVLTAKSE